ncbi:hypothetical protein [Chitinophaga solisilvae]|uniref:hypothetical protein n=1 Tax=Chitinophaga solisilvae TaxID=1233460 RepID=UPI00136D37C5|nr:hypothetical protein [Chitinophaga solisilvae]
MKNWLYCWCLLWPVLSAAAQERSTDVIIYTASPKKGLYRTFTEFQQNNPAEQGDFLIRNKSTAAQIYLLANRNELVLRDAAGQEHKVKKFWGYCDGRNIYIHDNGLNLISQLGYYCVYELQGVQPSRGIYNPADMTVNAINTPVRLKKVINIVTGEILELSWYNLKKYILPQDSALFGEFRADKSKREQLESYIYRFNQRNKPFMSQ